MLKLAGILVNSWCDHDYWFFVGCQEYARDLRKIRTSVLFPCGTGRISLIPSRVPIVFRVITVRFRQFFLTVTVAGIVRNAVDTIR